MLSSFLTSKILSAITAAKAYANNQVAIIAWTVDEEICETAVGEKDDSMGANRSVGERALAQVGRFG